MIYFSLIRQQGTFDTQVTLGTIFPVFTIRACLTASDVLGVGTSLSMKVVLPVTNFSHAVIRQLKGL